MTGKHQNGFSLVEIAIALVIIGLLIGGVVKAQEMIVNARLKNIEKGRSAISLSILAYHDRFRASPGDDPDASSRFSMYVDGINDPPANDINGDGDSLVEGNWIGSPNTETANLWKHLRAAGFIPGDGDDHGQPRNVYNGNIGVREGSMLIVGRVIVFGQIEGAVARILDSRLDDGDPALGIVQSEYGTHMMNGSLASNRTRYKETSRYFMSIRI